MTIELPSIRAELPFAASGPLHRVHSSARASLDDFLLRHRYLRVELDGTRTESRVAFHAEPARAMRFPDWYGANWDAFNDCFGGFLHDHAGAIVALIVNEADRIDAASAFEFGVASFGVEPRLIAATPFHAFAIGDAPDYGRPE